MDKFVEVFGNDIVVKGNVLWPTLKEPTAFKGTNKGTDDATNKKQEEKTYSITILVPKEAAKEAMGIIDNFGAERFEVFKETLSPADAINARFIPSGTKHHIDKATKTLTGQLEVSARRKEKFGRPLVRDIDGTEMDVNFLPKGTEVLVRMMASPYHNKVRSGVSYILRDIKVVSVSGGGVDIKTLETENPEADAVMGGSGSPESSESAPF